MNIRSWLFRRAPRLIFDACALAILFGFSGSVSAAVVVYQYLWVPGPYSGSLPTHYLAFAVGMDEETARRNMKLHACKEQETTDCKVIGVCTGSGWAARFTYRRIATGVACGLSTKTEALERAREKCIKQDRRCAHAMGDAIVFFDDESAPVYPPDTHICKHVKHYEFFWVNDGKLDLAPEEGCEHY